MHLFPLLSRLIIAFVCAFVFACTPEAAELSVRLKQLSVKQGVPFVLTLELRDGNDGLVKSAEPDFSSLIPTFTLVEVRRASFADFVDGRVKTGIRWQLTIKSAASGKIEIPAIGLGSLKSEVISIEVAANTEMTELTKQTGPSVTPQSVPASAPLAQPQQSQKQLLHSDLWLWLLAPLVGWISLSYWRQAQSWSYQILIAVYLWAWKWRCHIRLYRACRNNDSDAGKVAILVWGSYQQRRAANNLGQLAQQISHPQFSAAIMQLDRFLYARSQSWNGSELWLAFKAYQRSAWQNTARQDSDSEQRVLPGLYPRR